MHGYRATDIAWEVPVKSSSERLIVLALAKFSDENCESFPSFEAIAKFTKLNRKTVIAGLKSLAESGVISVQKSGHTANLYRLIGSPKNGGTEIGSPKLGSPNIGSPKNGTGGVPKTVPGEYQNWDGGSTEIGTLTDQLTDQLTEIASKAVSSSKKKTGSKKQQSVPASQTHHFDISSLPPEWKDYCVTQRPDLDPERVFVDFSFYFRSGKGQGQFRSDRGWAQSWQTWVRREKAKAAIAKRWSRGGTDTNVIRTYNERKTDVIQDIRHKTEDIYKERELEREVAPAPLSSHSPAHSHTTGSASKTHLLDFETLPETWRAYCQTQRPDLNPEKVFTDFRFYFLSGSGLGTRRSDKGWSQSWQNWVRREKEKARAASKPVAHTDINSTEFTADYYKQGL